MILISNFFIFLDLISLNLFTIQRENLKGKKYYENRILLIIFQRIMNNLFFN
jgi:hypothetical protein